MDTGKDDFNTINNDNQETTNSNIQTTNTVSEGGTNQSFFSKFYSLGSARPRRRLVKSSIPEKQLSDNNKEESKNDKFSLPVSESDLHPTEEKKSKQRCACNCTTLSDYVDRLVKRGKKLPKKITKIKEEFNKKNGETLRSDRQNLQLFLQENWIRIMVIIATLLICGITYSYLSNIKSDIYTENLKKDFLLASQDRHVHELPLVDVLASATTTQENTFTTQYITTTKLCFNEQDSKEQHLFFDDSLHDNSWKARCISDCVVVNEKTTIEKLTNKNCLSYALKADDNFGLYDRLLDVLYKQKILVDSCHGGRARNIDCKTSIEYNCTCGCRPFSSIILPSMVEDIYMWQMLNINKGQILEISESNLLYLNDTVLLHLLDKSRNTISQNAHLNGRDNHDKTPRDNVEQPTNEDNNDQPVDEELRLLYENTDDSSSESDKETVLSSFYGIVNTIVSSITDNNVNVVQKISINSVYNNTRSFNELEKEQKYNVISLFVSQFIKGYSRLQKQECNLDAIKYRYEPIYDLNSVSKSEYIKAISSEIKQITTKNSQQFLERYIILKEKIYDAFYQRKLSESFKLHLHYIDTPQKYIDIVQQHKNVGHRFDLYNFVDFYYKSHGKLEGNFWSPFFAINDVNYMQDILREENEFKNNIDKQHTTKDTIRENNADKNYLQMASNIISVAGSIASELYSNTANSLNEKISKNNDGNRILSIIKNKLLVESPTIIKQTQYTRNLFTSTLLTEIQSQSNIEEMYGSLVSAIQTPGLFGNTSISVLKHTQTQNDNVGSIYKLSNVFVENTKNSLDQEINLLVSLFKQYKSRSDIKKNPTYEKVKSSDIKLCSCGFNLLMPYNMVFASYQTYKNKMARVETMGWLKPAIIDRSSKIKPTKELPKTFFERISPEKIEQLTREELYTIDWQKDIYGYQYLLDIIYKDWKLILELVEDKMINPDGYINFPLLYGISTSGMNMVSKKSILHRAMDAFNISSTSDNEIDLQFIEHINPLTPNIFSIVEHYEQHADGTHLYKTLSKTNSFYEMQCVDFCTATWGMISEYSFKEYNTHVTKEASGYGPPPFRCSQENSHVCALEWALTAL